MMSKKWIPEDWTFKSREVAERFDEHVREQLPWYDHVTEIAALVGRHYIHDNSVVYDIGASTGNISRALESTIAHTNSTLHAIESSQEMADLYQGSGELHVADCMEFEYEDCHFVVVFLLLMFLPYETRIAWLEHVYKKLHRGGAIFLVDKIETPTGYAGTVMRRLTMDMKLQVGGATSEQIVEKELSLAGYQRPLVEVELELKFHMQKVFQFGEFAGWIIEKK
tara:strand:- start:2279 stop:2950 length:672 start_codon:yes stop_codon:yes gene_type:complete